MKREEERTSRGKDKMDREELWNRAFPIDEPWSRKEKFCALLWNQVCNTYTDYFYSMPGFCFPFTPNTRYWFTNIRIVCTCFSCLLSLHRLSQMCNPKPSNLCGLSQANFETVWIIVMPVTWRFLWRTIATDMRIALSPPTPPRFSSFAL